MLSALCYDERQGLSEVRDLGHISDLLGEGRLVWACADARAVSKTDVDIIAEELGLHELAVEDALKARQRPKLDVFDRHLFVVVHQLEEVGGQLEAAQVATFVGDRYLLTLHHGAQRVLGEVRKRWSEQADRLPDGSASLLYLLLDAIVDEYQEFTDALEDEVERVEELTLATLDLPPRQRMSAITETDVQRDLYSLRQRTARLRRYALPVERILTTLRSGAAGPLPRPVDHLFADVHDHIQRIGDQVRNIEALDAALLELRDSEQTAALNQINKKLTAWAAIIAAPTLISSIYGMNFKLFPFDGEPAGFFFALVLMGGAAGSLYATFRRKRWL